MSLPSAKKESEFLDYLVKKQNLSLDFFAGDLSRMMLGINTYDAEIAYLDSELKRVFDWFEKQGLNDDTLWIILADHGEGLGNHGYGGHSKYLYQEQLRVPLVFYSKRKGFSIGRVDQLVRLVDVLPALADLSDLALPSHPIQGVSFLSLLRGDKKNYSPVRYSYAQRRAKDSTPRRGERRAHWDDGEVFSLQTLGSKYIYHTKGDDEFFNLEEDPFETRNILSQPSAEKDELLKKLKELEPKVLSTKRGKRKKADRRILKELKSLGYL